MSNCTITDFEDGLDLLNLATYRLSGMGDLTLTQQGTDTLIDIDGTNTILVQNTDAADLTADDFIF